MSRRAADRAPAVAVAAGSLVALAIFVWSLGLPSAGSALLRSTEFPLDGTNDSTWLSFPDCANVSVTWTVTSGGPASFGVWPPAERAASDCLEHGASNSTPPPGYRSVEPGPVCYEAGRDGRCWFTADQLGYGFFLLGPWNGTAWQPVGDSVASVAVHWS